MAEGPARMVRPPRRRALLVYLALVVVPVLIAVAVLTGEPAGSGHPAGHLPGDPLAALLLAVAVVVAACAVAGRLAHRIGQPPVVGEIVAGLLLGPSLLGAVWPAASSVLLPAKVVPQLNVLAQIGVVMFLFLTGLEVETTLLRGRGRTAVVVSHVSIAVPFLLGVLAAVAAYGRLAPPGISYSAFALFLGVSMSVTALPVLVRILVDLGLLRQEIGVVALTCALIDDVTAWCLLALAVALVTASSALGALTTVALTAVFVAVLMLLVRPALLRFVRRANDRTQRGAAPLALVGVLLSAMTTQWIGVHAMFGAFLFGLVFPKNNALATWLLEKVRGMTTTLLLPLFFAYSGLQTDVGLIGGNGALWLWCGLLLLIAVVGKLGGTAVAARAAGEGWRRSLQLGAMMNCRGLTELVVLNIGLQLGVLSRTMFTMLVIMALLSTAMTVPLVRLLTPRRGLPAAVDDPIRAALPADLGPAEEQRAA
jgi:K+:H+ antiporter